MSNPVPFSSFCLNFYWLLFGNSPLFFISNLMSPFLFIICLKHLFIYVCNLLVIWLVVFQVSQAYNNTDFSFVVNICILTLFDMLWFLHTGYSWTNTPFAFLILLATSSSVPPFTDTTLPRYTKNPTTSISVSSNLNFCMLDVLTLIPFVLFMLTHCGRVTQICVFNTVKLGTSASSP